ncbi:proline/glycine betaine ABC transporter permease [Irregularibacter muris]|uniref:Proline/glycine betaine ABC transporter permease n=1 Tax=Irregularibacter muris TaxID=1796619 RepID=A0AAE3KZN4_9FIRM|nr:proline/glycine betaine ABC transporter permease [Irregularibacter muris]MCR1898547.1 proline/glycine betaine ABC transporter permease [Irregularibacter muris]
MINFHIGPAFEAFIDWLTNNFASFFDGMRSGILFIIEGFESILLFPPALLLIAIIALIAWKVAGKGVAIFSLIGLFLIDAMGLWDKTMQSLGLVLTATSIALIIGVPLGIWSAKSDKTNQIMRPIMDFMQTMPAFVYLIPAVIFFDLGKVPGAVATVIFAMPPVVRLTGLGIRQVPEDIIEASRSFGATSKQMLFQVQIPLAIPTILAGINQTIMLALSMVVISAMIGAGGLGEEVLKGITQLEIGTGFESGIAVVILAMVLDRITQSLGTSKKI